jgi:hypothetical protein
MTKAIRLLQENPDEAKVLVRPYFADMDAETFETVMRKYVPGAAKSPVVSRAQFEAALKWASIGAAKRIEVPYEAVVETSFAEAALAGSK